MKVLMLNGSPHEKGCTYTALAEVAGELNQAGIETEIMHVGGGTVHGCMGCGACGKLGKCIYSDDKVNEAVEKMRQSDGLIVGSPVHYASAGGAITSFLDRFFYSGSSAAAHKPGAAVASARRAGTTATLDQLNKYFMITQMPVVSSQYWNMVHGQCPEDVKRMKKACRLCVYWAGTWPGCSNPLRPEKLPELRCLRQRKRNERILYGRKMADT